MKSHFYFKVFSITSLLVMIPVAHASASSKESHNRGKEPGDILYHASFDWKDSITQKTKKLEIIVTKNAKPGFWDSKVGARIMNGEQVEATCRADNLEVVSSESGAPKVATSMDLTCHSTSLGALGAPATVFFQAGSQTPVLRFGSWLQGYEQAYLRVEKDRSAQLVKEMHPDAQKDNTPKLAQLTSVR